MEIPVVNFDQLTWAPKKKAARRVALEPCDDIETPKLKRSKALDFTPFAVRCKQSPNHELNCNNRFDERFRDYNELSQLSQSTEHTQYDDTCKLCRNKRDNIAFNKQYDEWEKEQERIKLEQISKLNGWQKEQYFKQDTAQRRYFLLSIYG